VLSGLRVSAPAQVEACDDGGHAGAYHHPSHDGLVDAVSTAPLQHVPVDAIFVPTARPAPYLRESLRVAAELDCALVTLCSKEADAHAAVIGAKEAGVRAFAVDIDRFDLTPRMQTSKLISDTRFRRRTDTSYKRNLCLLIAKMVGWERVVFLDDDIVVRQATDLNLAAALLETYDAVGLVNDGFPDNSVVCHAYRAVGHEQGTFIGGGAMAVAVDRADSFFPDIYNEDWFFLLDDTRIRPVAKVGRIIQKPFDPYADPNRAKSEELGDCLAEGVYALLDEGKRVRDANARFWEVFLADRKRMINRIIASVPSLNLSPHERARMMTALKSAQSLRMRITPDLCASYLQAWRADRGRWRRFVDHVHQCDSVEAAFVRLNVDSCNIFATEDRFRPVSAMGDPSVRQDIEPVAVGEPKVLTTARSRMVRVSKRTTTAAAMVLPNPFTVQSVQVKVITAVAAILLVVWSVVLIV